MKKMQAIIAAATVLGLVLCPVARAGQVIISSESPHFVFSYAPGGGAGATV